MGYLIYVSHDAENLQFYLWLNDYTNRFLAASKQEKALSPPWTEHDLIQQIAPYADAGPRIPDKAAQEYPVDFDSKSIPRAPVEDSRLSLSSGSVGDKTVGSAEYANQQTGLKWQPCAYSFRKTKEAFAYSSSHYSTLSCRDQSCNLPLSQPRCS